MYENEISNYPFLLPLFSCNFSLINVSLTKIDRTSYIIFFNKKKPEKVNKKPVFFLFAPAGRV